MKTALVVAAVWLFGVCCFAGDATFSRDGKRVYTIESAQKNAAVREIDLTNETQRVIPLPDCGVRLDSIAQSEDEKIYCLGVKTLWLVDPASGAANKIITAPQGSR
jgi:hypothetical protein